MKNKKTVSFSKNATNIFFHILTKCNLSCIHCYINKKQHGSNILSIDTICNWLKVFCEKNKNPNVIFLGGEPTIHKNLSEAVTNARNLAYNSITIDTNGYLFNDILLKLEPSQVDFMSFSLDGASEDTNDFIRGKGSYKRCIAGIKEAQKKGFSTSLIYTVSNTNINELYKMIELLKDLKIDKFFIQVIGIRGKSAKININNLQVSKNDWFKIIPDVAVKVAEQGISVTYPKVFLEHDEIFECAGIIANNYFVFPNGRVYRCPLCEDFPLHSMEFVENELIKTDKINEMDLFELNIHEGCVMNKIIQPDNLSYDSKGRAEYKIACCMLKEEILVN